MLPRGVERRHRRRDCVALLKDLDGYHAHDCTIRIRLDDHAAHISKETMAFLATHPNRFKYLFRAGYRVKRSNFKVLYPNDKRCWLPRETIERIHPELDYKT